MYNAIGLTTPRGSGTNGYVQRNLALALKPKDRKPEKDSDRLKATLRRPNYEILNHERKRRIEIKCMEFEQMLEDQGLSSTEIGNKITEYRDNLITQEDANSKETEAKGTHEVSEAQQRKNEKLRQAFGISEYFQEGSSFDPERRAKEAAAKALDAQYALVPSPPSSDDATGVNDSAITHEKKSSTESEYKKKKKKKKKRKRKSDPSSDEEVVSKRAKTKMLKHKKRNKKERSPPTSSSSVSPVRKKYRKRSSLSSDDSYVSKSKKQKRTKENRSERRTRTPIKISEPDASSDRSSFERQYEEAKRTKKHKRSQSSVHRDSRKRSSKQCPHSTSQTQPDKKLPPPSLKCKTPQSPKKSDSPAKDEARRVSSVPSYDSHEHVGARTSGEPDDGSSTSTLSYSPLERYPDRYREIIGNVSPRTYLLMSNNPRYYWDRREIKNWPPMSDYPSHRRHLRCDRSHGRDRSPTGLNHIHFHFPLFDPPSSDLTSSDDYEPPPGSPKAEHFLRDPPRDTPISAARGAINIKKSNDGARRRPRSDTEDEEDMRDIPSTSTGVTHARPKMQNVKEDEKSKAEKEKSKKSKNEKPKACADLSRLSFMNNSSDESEQDHAVSRKIKETEEEFRRRLKMKSARPVEVKPEKNDEEKKITPKKEERSRKEAEILNKLKKRDKIPPNVNINKVADETKSVVEEVASVPDTVSPSIPVKNDENTDIKLVVLSPEVHGPPDVKALETLETKTESSDGSSALTLNETQEPVPLDVVPVHPATPQLNNRPALPPDVLAPLLDYGPAPPPDDRPTPPPEEPQSAKGGTSCSKERKRQASPTSWKRSTKKHYRSSSSSSTDSGRVVGRNGRSRSRSNSSSSSRSSSWSYRDSRRSWTRSRSRRRSYSSSRSWSRSRSRRRDYDSRSSDSSRSRRSSRSYGSSRSHSRSHRSSRSPRSSRSHRSRSASIPRRRGSPSFLDRRRITSARKRPIPYKSSTLYFDLMMEESSSPEEPRRRRRSGSSSDRSPLPWVSPRPRSRESRSEE